MTQSVTGINDFFAAIDNPAVTEVVVPDLNFFQFEKLNLIIHRAVKITSHSRGAVFPTLLVSGSHPLSITGCYVERLVADTQVTIVDCEVTNLQVSDICQVRNCVVDSIRILLSGTLILNDSTVDGFLVVDGQAKFSGDGSKICVDNFSTTTSSKVLLRECVLHTEKRWWWIKPKIELPYGSYVRCSYNFNY